MKARTRSKLVAFTSLGAALYSIGSYATAYIQSPWGLGQFRPAVVIPSIFALLLGPAVGGLSAAIGTLIADSVKHATLYIPSLVAAVPSNFLAFYLFGKLLQGKFRWPRFIAASVLALGIGNALCAVLYALYQATIGVIPIGLLPGLSIGLTVWWFSTMLPFQLLVVPPVLRALAKSVPNLVPQDVIRECLEGVTPKSKLVITLLLTGCLAVGVAALTVFSREVASFFVGALRPDRREAVKSLIAFMFSVTGAALLATGSVLAVARRA